MPAPDTEIGQLIYIVDDDAAIRTALCRLVRSMGWRAEAFASPAEFLKREDREIAGCLLLDVQLPGMSGFELHARIAADGQQTPVIFITALPESETATKAELAKAVACLQKPFDDELLAEAIRTALERDTDGPPRSHDLP